LNLPLPELAKTRDQSSLSGTSGTNAAPQTGSGVVRSSADKSASRRYPRILFILFLCSLPLVNPIVHGDGVGYYAYVRAPLIQHNLHFEQDWLRANLLFTKSRTLSNGQLSAAEYTETGHVSNLFSIGPALLWAPFLLAAHGIVLFSNAHGAHIAADGFSFPYLLAMALGTAIYGFLGLLFSYSLARKYVEDRWAFLGTLGIWGASSLPVYMYFNPSWSHAHSVFAVALFLWYWERTRGSRTFLQWILLGLISGLMLDVYFANGVFLVLPLIESLAHYWDDWKALEFRQAGLLFAANFCYLLTMILCFVPTLVTRYIIFGGVFRFSSYQHAAWDWTAPHWYSILFSTEHGILLWTPILALAIFGLVFVPRRAKVLTSYLSAGAAAFFYLISCYPDWAGISAFGNRFFISVTPIFIFGLALLLQRFGGFFRSSTRAFSLAASVLVLFIVWNAGFMFQWGAHLISPRGPVSFSEVAYNQIFVVPRELSSDLRRYFFGRKAFMQQIEQRDIQQQKDPASQ
jgi:hypothetical protein